MGLTVQPNSRPGNPGHVLIPELNYGARKDKRKKAEGKRWRATLAAAVREGDVHGPFPTIQDPPHDEPSGERP